MDHIRVTTIRILAIVGAVSLLLFFFGGGEDVDDMRPSTLAGAPVEESPEEYVERAIAARNAEIEDWLNDPRWEGAAWYGSVSDVYWRKPMGITIELLPNRNGTVPDRVGRSVIHAACSYLDYSGDDYGGVFAVSDGSREVVAGMVEWNGVSPWFPDQ